MKRDSYPGERYSPIAKGLGAMGAAGRDAYANRFGVGCLAIAIPSRYVGTSLREAKRYPLGEEIGSLCDKEYPAVRESPQGHSLVGALPNGALFGASPESPRGKAPDGEPARLVGEYPHDVAAGRPGRIGRRVARARPFSFALQGGSLCLGGELSLSS